MIRQQEITLNNKKRGFHLVTKEILNSFDNLPEQGIFHIFTKHTSCGLTLNENCAPSVREDFETSFNKLISENPSNYTHTAEGVDDMPAHLKSSIIGSSLSIPITDNKLNLGTWQGIYFCEFRNNPTNRKLLITIYH